MLRTTSEGRPYDPRRKAAGLAKGARPALQVDSMFSNPLTVMLGLVSLGAQFVVFLRWMHRRVRDDEIQRAFIRDLALKHLPAIYSALHMMAEQQGIALDETPIVNYVDLRNGHRRG
jgi:hypothetical protein